MLSNEFQHERVWVVYKHIFVRVLWKEVASALEWLKRVKNHISAISGRLLLVEWKYLLKEHSMTCYSLTPTSDQVSPTEGKTLMN